MFPATIFKSLTLAMGGFTFNPLPRPVVGFPQYIGAPLSPVPDVWFNSCCYHPRGHPSDKVGPSGSEGGEIFMFSHLQEAFFTPRHFV